MKTLWVKRTDSSSYFPSGFAELEKQALEAVAGVRYLGASDPVVTSGPVCLLTNTHTNLAKWQNFSQQIELILHPNSGMDNLASDLKHWHVPTVLGNPIRAQAVTEWVLSCLFQHFASIHHHSVWPKGRQWERSLLSDQKVLMVGQGHVGILVKRALENLGISPRVHDPFLGLAGELNGAWDVVILVASSNPTNQEIISEQFLATLPAQAVIINPARADLISESALRKFFKRNPQARAYLDVHRQEPYAANYWQDCPQVISTPHIAGVWSGLISAMLQFEVQILSSWMTTDRAQFEAQYAALLAQTRLTDKGWYR